MKQCFGFAFGLLALAGCAEEAHRPPSAPPAREIALEGLPKAAPPRGPRGLPECTGDTFALVGPARGRELPHWVDCRSGERVEYFDPEFETWFNARRSARASAPQTR
jgi:hypothetical protein